MEHTARYYEKRALESLDRAAGLVGLDSNEITNNARNRLISTAQVYATLALAATNELPDPRNYP